MFISSMGLSISDNVSNAEFARESITGIIFFSVAIPIVFQEMNSNPSTGRIPLKTSPS